MNSIKFRPIASILHTIGDNIIKDIYAAVVELVKNSYDADAKEVVIEFIDFKDMLDARILIKDDGHGMSSEDIINKWLIPGTSNKFNLRKTPNGRNMQGRKGIGRFAAAILGDDFDINTTDSDGNTTHIHLNWSKFNSVKYLDEIEIGMETTKTNLHSGTEIVIKPQAKISEWTKETLDNLVLELRKMISPYELQKEFSILFKCKNIGIDEFEAIDTIIEPIPLLDLFDYRLHGTIDEQGNMDLEYINNIEKGLAPEKIFHRVPLFFGRLCAPITIDFRVFDRDPESIESLIERGKLDLDRISARRLLDKSCGISIFRNGFRIRPYGDPGFDWIQLDKQRVQDPSKKIGSNQIIGSVEISNEEESKLVEKSARDGLKEDNRYYVLHETVLEVIKILAERRYDFRSKTGRGRKPKNISKEIEKLFDLERIKKSLKTEFDKKNISQETMGKIQEVISLEEKEKAKSLETIKEIIAMYQGQITVGKIISVLMHEGRKPLKYLKEGSPLIINWIETLKLEANKQVLLDVVDRLGNVKTNSLLLIELFDRLNPLAFKKRGKKQNHSVSQIIKNAISLFGSELEKEEIEIYYDKEDKLTFYGWEQDLYIALTNLFDNSLYWLTQNTSKKDKKIWINAMKEENRIIIEFIDNGPGIKQEYIEKELLFEPGFSTKPLGTGLGLAISGEAIERNGGTLKAIYKSDGAHLRIELPFTEKD